MYIEHVGPMLHKGTKKEGGGEVRRERRHVCVAGKQGDKNKGSHTNDTQQSEVGTT